MVARIVAVQSAEITILVVAGVLARRYDLRQCIVTALLGMVAVAVSDCLLLLI